MFSYNPRKIIFQIIHAIKFYLLDAENAGKLQKACTKCQILVKK